ncbi:MAG TPA: tetratricopeptide repeat protein [candidate division Zixibacteria bacterium]|nr:tetratricopeptide repeat protein [candidate division Zixibacteria bacterium]
MTPQQDLRTGITKEAVRHLRLLGPVTVDRILDTQKNTAKSAGDEIAAPRFRSQRTVGLLGYLVTERRPIAREHLALLFWPDDEPSKGRANLRRELYNLARILPDCWELNRQSVAFFPLAGTSVDLDQLLQLERQERWGDAARLLGGDFLEGVNLDHNVEFENWLSVERERWRGRSETVLRRVIDGHTRRGRYTEALHHAQRLLRLASWDEETHTQVMRLLAWTGQRGAALRQFETCKQMLWDELGVKPSVETTLLNQQIQAGKLDIPPQLPAYLTEERARHNFEQPLFVRREEELELMDAFMDASLSGKCQVIFITGGPGRGKTALLDAFSRRAMEMHPNLLVASGKCNAYSGVGDPYLPFRDVMAMLTGDVEGRWDAGAIAGDHAQRLWNAFPLVVQVLLDQGPDLLDVFVPSALLLSLAIASGQDNAAWFSRLREDVKRRAASTVDVEQSQLFQQFTKVVCSMTKDRPLLLILDDIQWADTATISLLFHLGRRLAEADCRILIACAYRPEEVAPGLMGDRHPLAKALSEFKRSYGDVWIDLGRVEEEEDRRFVAALLDAEPNRLDGNFRSCLYDRTGGHPLFTVELLRAMQDRGYLIKDANGAWIEGPTLDWQVLPARVEAVIEERINRLNPELRDILTIGSVEGEVFTAQVVAEVRNMTERSLLGFLSQDLELQHRLVREQEEVYTGQKRLSRYRFGHILYQDYLYQLLSKGEKRLLHADIAAALEKLYEGQLEEMTVQLAHHFYLAGDYGRAFHYFSQAGERAARIYASREAITHYTRAIQLADQVGPDVVTRATLHRGRGLARETLGEFELARVDHETILEIASAAGESQTEMVEWRALIDLGKLWRSRDYDRARDCFEAALELARRTDDQAVLADSLNWMGNWYANDEKPLRAVEYHREALKIVEQLGERRALAITLDLLGIANLLGGNLNTSAQYYNRAIDLFRELHDFPRLATSLMGRASISAMLAVMESVAPVPRLDAASDFDEALRIAGKIDSAPDEAWAYWSYGLWLTVSGQFGHAYENVQSGLRIASEIGHLEFVVANQFALGIWYLEIFAPDHARKELEDALASAKELHSATMIHLVTGALASAYLMLDEPELALDCLEDVIAPQTPMDTSGKRYCWLRRAELALLQDDPVFALEIVERLIATAPGMSPGRVITFLWKLKAECLVADAAAKDAAAKDAGAENASVENALLLLVAAIENAEEAEERFLLWRLHASMGQLYKRVGHRDLAEKENSTARLLIDESAATLPDEASKDRFRQGAYNILRTPG